MRASVELAKDWRTDRMLSKLEAMLLVADRESTLIITGNGDVLEPEHGIVAIGSAAARHRQVSLIDEPAVARLRQHPKGGLYGELAGDLTAGVTTETVGDHPGVIGRAVRVLVAGPHPTD